MYFVRSTMYIVRSTMYFVRFTITCTGFEIYNYCNNFEADLLIKSNYS